MWTATCRSLLPKPVQLSKEHQELRSQLLETLTGCVYCGDVPQTNDHFRPVIGDDAMPTGFCNDDWNVVPACFMCNCSKHNKHWRTFMERTTGKAPRPRGVKDVDARIQALAEFEAASNKFAQRWHVTDELRVQLQQLHGVLTAAMKLHAEGTARLKALIRGGAAVQSQSTPAPVLPVTSKRAMSALDNALLCENTNTGIYSSLCPTSSRSSRSWCAFRYTK